MSRPHLIPISEWWCIANNLKAGCFLIFTLSPHWTKVVFALNREEFDRYEALFAMVAIRYNPAAFVKKYFRNEFSKS